MADTLLLGTRKGFLTYRRQNGTFAYDATHFRGIPASLAVADSRNGRWWALLDHGHWGCKLHRSDDQGKNWTEIEAPKFPEGEEVKDGVPAVLRYLWAFAEGGTDHPDRIWIGCEPGGLFRSDDGGDSFELVRSLWDHPTRKEGWFGGGRDHPGIHSIVVDPRDSNRLWIGISCAGVFESRDAGKTWAIRNKGLKADFLPDPDSEVGQDPHIVVACPSNPDAMWQQNHCGIFRTTDAGANWSECGQSGGPAHFGFAVAVDENDPDTAWVVPAESDEIRVAVDKSLCVCRTDDGGRTWTDFRTGLPQGDAFDIVFRHALDVSGDELVFGTTTGNLYHSVDRGETWKAISHNLPLIHSVQFV